MGNKEPRGASYEELVVLGVPGDQKGGSLEVGCVRWLGGDAFRNVLRYKTTSLGKKIRVK